VYRTLSGKAAASRKKKKTKRPSGLRGDAWRTRWDVNARGKWWAGKGKVNGAEKKVKDQ
jgi:hypothetical protein